MIPCASAALRIKKRLRQSYTRRKQDIAHGGMPADTISPEQDTVGLILSSAVNYEAQITSGVKLVVFPPDMHRTLTLQVVELLR